MQLKIGEAEDFTDAPWRVWKMGASCIFLTLNAPCARRKVYGEAKERAYDTTTIGGRLVVVARVGWTL